MKRKPEITTSFTSARFASLTGIDRHELQRRLEDLQANPTGKTAQHAPEYSLRDLVKAFAGGDLEAERLRKTRAEAERIELQNSRTRGEQVEITSVKKLGEKIMIAIRQRILAFPLSEDEQDVLLKDLMALGELDWSREG